MYGVLCNVFQQLMLKFIFDDSRHPHSFHSTVKDCQHDICCNTTILYSKTHLKMDVRVCKSGISAFDCARINSGSVRLRWPAVFHENK